MPAKPARRREVRASTTNNLREALTSVYSDRDRCSALGLLGIRSKQRTSAWCHFAVNPRRAPQRILAAHLANQFPYFKGDWRSFRLAAAHLPGPDHPKPFALPGNHRLRFHDGQPVQNCDNRAQRNRSARSASVVHRALQNVKLLAKSEHLNLKGAQGCRVESPKQTPLLSDSSRGRFSDAPPGIPEPRLSSNNLSSGEVGVSANNRSPRQTREQGVREGKSGYCNRALVDRVSENHRQRPKAAQTCFSGLSDASRNQFGGNSSGRAFRHPGAFGSGAGAGV